MNAFATVVLALAVASVSAGYSSGYYNYVHKPSGIVSANHDGALIVGPSGSVHTNNGLHGHGAGVQLAGPSGSISTHGGHAHVIGPVKGQYQNAVYVAPAAHNYGAYGGYHGGIVAGHATHATIVGPTSHATIVGPSAHTVMVAPVAQHSWGHQASAYGHHGW